LGMGVELRRTEFLPLPLVLEDLPAGPGFEDSPRSPSGGGPPSDDRQIPPEQVVQPTGLD
jgi:hypothetical protein